MSRTYLPRYIYKNILEIKLILTALKILKFFSFRKQSNQSQRICWAISCFSSKQKGKGRYGRYRVGTVSMQYLPRYHKPIFTKHRYLFPKYWSFSLGIEMKGTTNLFYITHQLIFYYNTSAYRYLGNFFNHATNFFNGSKLFRKEHCCSYWCIAKVPIAKNLVPTYRYMLQIM